MTRIALLVVAVGTALALAGTAAAKEVSTLRACGSDGCATVTDRDRLAAMPLGGETEDDPPRPGAYYTLDYTFTPDNHRVRLFYVPGADMIAGDGEFGGVTWFTAHGVALAQVVSELEPFAAPTRWPSQIPHPAGTSRVSSSGDEEGGSGWTYWLALGSALIAALGIVLAQTAAGPRRSRPSPS